MGTVSCEEELQEARVPGPRAYGAVRLSVGKCHGLSHAPLHMLNH